MLRLPGNLHWWNRQKPYWLTEHKQATRNDDVNNHIAEHHLQTKHQIDWDLATCITYSTVSYQRLALESWFTNLEQMPRNRLQQLQAPQKTTYWRNPAKLTTRKRPENPKFDYNKRLLNCDNRRIERHQRNYESSQLVTSRLNWQRTNNTAISLTNLVPVDQTVDNAIHRINLYKLDSAICFPNSYPLDSDLYCNG